MDLTIKNTKENPGLWSLYVNGRRYIESESYAVVLNVADCLKGYGDPTSECQEVADSIIAKELQMKLNS